MQSTITLANSTLEEKLNEMSYLEGPRQIFQKGLGAWNYSVSILQSYLLIVSEFFWLSEPFHPPPVFLSSVLSLVCRINLLSIGCWLEVIFLGQSRWTGTVPFMLHLVFFASSEMHISWLSKVMVVQGRHGTEWFTG